MEPIEIFRAGRHTSSDGRTADYSARMLADCARSYDPTRYEAPIVVGHPKLDAPAYGWVDSLEVSGDKLVARPKQVDPQFSELVRAGRFKRVSASFYLPQSANNPTPGSLYLRHVGFLGAAAPAVTGLKPVAFSEEDDGVVSFDTGDFDREAALRGREDAVRREGNRLFLDRLVNEARVHPGEREAVASFMECLDNEGVVSFADADGKPSSIGAADWFRNWLSSRTPIVTVGVICPPGPLSGAAFTDYEPPPGYGVDPVGAELHRKAVAYQNANGGDYRSAVAAVAGTTRTR